MALAGAIQRIQDVLRKDAAVDGDAQRIAQLSWLLFLKAFDSHESVLEKNETRFRSAIPSELRWRNWTSAHRDVLGDKLIQFVNDELFPGLRRLEGDCNHARLVRSAFESVRNYMSSGVLLRQVIDLLDAEIAFSDRRGQHLIGDIYEKILTDLQSAGNAGEFYTPRALTDFIVARIDPKPGERVLDFACGTGGFLISTLDHWATQYNVVPYSGSETHGLMGVEKKSLPHLLCMTNMLLHGNDRAEAIERGNLLDRPLSTYADSDRVDVIITNPPFGGLEEDGIHSNFPEQLRSKDTADLFVVLLMHLLRDGGRAAIILPDGFLFGSGAKRRIRKRLLECCELDTLVRLPKGVFAPYTGIATNILFLRRGRPTSSVWYFSHQYPKGQKSYSKTQPIHLKEFQAEVEWWADRVKTPHAWSVSSDDIAARDYRLDSRNPHQASRRRRMPTTKIRALSRTRSALATHRSDLVDFLRRTLRASDNRRKEALLAEIELITDTADGILLLRDLLLDYGISGQLSVPQGVRNDAESLARNLFALRSGGSELDFSQDGNGIERTRASLPRHWTEIPLEEVADVVGGGTPKSTDPDNFSTNGVPWVTPADLYDLKGKYIKSGRRDLSDKGLASCSARVLPKGTVLFSSRAPIGYVAIAANPIATNQGFKSCVPLLPEMSEYLYYFLLAERRAIEADAPGTTFREVSGRAMKAVRVPLPTLEEQSSIVKALDEGFSILDSLRELTTRSDEQSVEVVANLVSYAGV